MPSLIIFITFGVSGLLIAGLGIPLARRSVPPNHLYGLRVPETLNDEAVWYEANARSGRDMIVAGSIIAVLALILFLAGVDVTIAALVDAGVMIVVAAFACIRGWRLARRLSRAQAPYHR